MVYYTETKRLDLLFEALSHHHRRDLIAEIAGSEAAISISDFARRKKLSLQNAGKHVRILEKAKLIRRKKVGVENYLAINQAALAEAEAWIENHHQYWEARFTEIDIYIKETKNG